MIHVILPGLFILMYISPQASTRRHDTSLKTIHTCMKLEKVTQTIMSLWTIFSSCGLVSIQSFRQSLRKSEWYASTSSTLDTWRSKQLSNIIMHRSITWPFFWIWMDITTQTAMCSIVSYYFGMKLFNEFINWLNFLFMIKRRAKTTRVDSAKLFITGNKFQYLKAVHVMYFSYN